MNWNRQHEAAVGAPVQLPSERFDSVTALASAFGGPICEPTVWPRGSGVPKYLLGEGPGVPMYRFEVAQNEGSPISVLGYLRPRSQRAGVNGWQHVPELGRQRGLAISYGHFWHLVVSEAGQTVHLIGYRSRADAIEAAQSLRVVEPPP